MKNKFDTIVMISIVIALVHCMISLPFDVIIVSGLYSTINRIPSITDTIDGEI